MTDPQAAMQAGALTVIPGFLIAAAVLGRLVTVSFPALLATCAVVALADALLFRRNVRRFQREEILTRWK